MVCILNSKLTRGMVTLGSLTLLMVSMGAACGGSTGTPTPVPTAVPTAAPTQSAPVELLSLQSSSGGYAAFDPIFGGQYFGQFTVAKTGIPVNGKFKATAPVNFGFTVIDPNGSFAYQAASTGLTQNYSFSFTPVIAGAYYLGATAVQAIAPGVTISVVLTQ